MIEVTRNVFEEIHDPFVQIWTNMSVSAETLIVVVETSSVSLVIWKAFVEKVSSVEETSSVFVETSTVSLVI